MRLLIIHNRYRSAQPSGEDAVVDEERSILLERGLDVHLFTVESDAIAGWAPHKKALLPARVVWSREGARLVGEQIRRIRPDVVHFHNTFPLLSPAALRAASARDVRVVKTLHNFRPLCPSGMLFRDGKVCEECLGRTPVPAVRHACYRGSRLATLPLAMSDAVHERLGTWRDAADVYITPSGFARSRYVEAGWPPEKLVVKYNTVRDVTARRDGPGTGFVCLARLGPEKGVETLLRAWAAAFPDGGEGLAVIGSGDLEPRLRRIAETVPGVEMTGQLPREAAMERIRQSRAVVMPSIWYEVFPRTVVEAYALGVPVLASRLGSLPEVVPDGQSGLLFEPGSSDDLAAVLCRTAASDSLGVDLGIGARKLYDEMFNPQATTDRLVSIYSPDFEHTPTMSIAGAELTH
jgi:glycosyltransferase involved in cell wall biosynthesis